MQSTASGFKHNHCAGHGTGRDDREKHSRERVYQRRSRHAPGAGHIENSAEANDDASREPDDRHGFAGILSHDRAPAGRGRSDGPGDSREYNDQFTGRAGPLRNRSRRGCDDGRTVFHGFQLEDANRNGKRVGRRGCDGRIGGCDRRNVLSQQQRSRGRL